MTVSSVPADGIVEDGYEHQDKTADPMPGVPGRPGLKWYEIRFPAAAVDAEVRELAREIIATDADFGPDDTGFVVLHLCGESFYFLLICRWRNNNEMWETVWTKNGADDLAPILSADATRAAFCVWELAVVNHERQAWTRYLRSSRDVEARAAYLADRFSGPV
jgi:hypothetical protein